MADIVRGDRIRVTQTLTETNEGTVRFWRNDKNFDAHMDCGLDFHGSSLPGVVSVELIEPPVVTFGPGQTVRYKNNHKYAYHLGAEGYLAVSDGHFYRWANSIHRPEMFTSLSYELVNLNG